MSVKIRNYVKGEPLPAVLCNGYESGKNVMADWIWVVVLNARKITAILVTSPAHIMVLFIRLLSTEDAEINDVRTLLSHAVSEMKKRGYNGYFTWLDPTKEMDQRLMGIFRSSGGTQFTQPQVLCAGRV